MDRSGKGIMGFFDLKIMMTTTRIEEKKLFEQEEEQYKYLEVDFLSCVASVFLWLRILHKQIRRAALQIKCARRIATTKST